MSKASKKEEKGVRISREGVDEGKEILKHRKPTCWLHQSPLANEKCRCGNWLCELCVTQYCRKVLGFVTSRRRYAYCRDCIEGLTPDDYRRLRRNP